LTKTEATFSDVQESSLIPVLASSKFLTLRIPEPRVPGQDSF